jgi:uncharacterized protein (TIGR00730 family)
MNTEAFRNLDFMFSEAARNIRIMADYSYAEDVFYKEKVKDTIVIFGSARIIPDRPDHPATKLIRFYDETVQLSEMITRWGQEISTPGIHDRLLVCTGGGPGIMEAGNRGAKQAGGRSISLNIHLPYEQYPNPYSDPKLTFHFHYFFIRKLWFVHLAEAVVVMPGGFGTVDELFETLTLIQTHRAKKIPVVLYGPGFWNQLVNFDTFVEYGLIDKEDLELFHISDSPQDTLDFLQKHVRV